MPFADISATALGFVEGDVQANQKMMQLFQQQISQTTTFYTLTLKPVQNGPFAAQYDITVQDLQLPKQVDLSQ